MAQVKPFTATVVLLFSTVGLAQQASRQANPRDYPAHDAHEGVVIAADPYFDRARSQQVFGSYAPNKAGVLAVEIIVKNENNQGINVNWSSAQLLAGKRLELRALTMEELTFRLVGEAKTRQTVPSRWPPLPSSNKAKEYEKARAALAPHFFETGTIPPGATARGFLFFDVGGDFPAVAHARLYVPDVKIIATGQPLMFFEIEFR
jgi:hypothetical protein